MAVVIGVDCGGRKLNAVAVNTDLEIVDFFKYEFSLDMPRGSGLKAMHSFIKSKVDEIPGKTFGWVEAPIVAGARNLQSSLKIAQVTGVVQAGMYNVSEVAVGSWKKEVIGRGNANKEDVASWVKENYSHAYRTLGGIQDYIDAFCIALYGQAVKDRLHTLIGS